MLIVSFTTIRERLRLTHIVVGSLLAQSLKPDLVVLNISSESYLLDDGVREEDLPREVRALRDAGRLVISMVANTGPYRKLLPLAANLVETDAIIVTADDDVLYPGDWLRGLVEAHLARNCSTAYRARGILVRNSAILPYAEWRMARLGAGGNHGDVQPRFRSLLTMPTGRDGVLYRAAWFRNADLVARLQMLAPKQDDLAFRCALIAEGIPVEVVPYSAAGAAGPFLEAGRSRTALYSGNVVDNDLVISALFRLLEDEGIFRLVDHLISPDEAQAMMERTTS